MDLLAAHRHGLVDQLEVEARGLAGRPADAVARGIAYHHLYDHSAGLHVHALLCARAALTLEGAVAGLASKARRARWRLGAVRSVALLARIDAFGAALREIDRARCEAMLVAYRLSRRPALHDVAKERFGDVLVEALIGEDRRALFLANQAWQEAQWGLALEGALAGLAWPLGAAPLAAIVAAMRPSIDDFEAHGAKGWARVSRAVAAHRGLPKGYAANPGDAYYRLQRQVADRRRRAMVQADFEPEVAVVVADAA